MEKTSLTLPLPSPEQNYEVTGTHKLTAALWNAVFLSVSTRVAAIEAKGVTLDEVVADLQVFGLIRLDESLNPLIAEKEQELADLSASIGSVVTEITGLLSGLEATIASTITAQTDLVASQLATLNAAIDVIQDTLGDIEANGASASFITETVSRVFVTPAEKALISTALQKAGGTMTGVVKFKRQTLTISSGTLTIPVDTADFFDVNLTSNISDIILTGLPAEGDNVAWGVTLRLKITGSFTVTWPAIFKHIGSGTAPVISTTAGREALFGLFILNNSRVNVTYAGSGA